VALTQLPPASQVSDAEFVSVAGPDNITISFLYDREQHAFYAKESQVLFPSKHGKTHIGDDPVPLATCDTMGLMAPDDKCKLDALLQTRLGVLGFMGAGFPDDGGWMQGDIILAAGTEFIHLERIGNVIRFTCFVPGSQVLMADGTTMAIEDIAEGIEVVSHTGVARTVTKTYQHRVSTTVYSFNTSGHRSGCFTVTSEHPVLAVHRPPSARCRQHRVRNCRRCLGAYGSPHWIRANALRVGDFIARRFASATINDVELLEMAEHVDRSAVVAGRLHNTESRSRCANAVGSYDIDEQTFLPGGKAINPTVSVGPELMRLFGYYLAEGSISHSHGNPVGIVFSVSCVEAFGDMGADIAHCCDVVFGHRPATYADKQDGNGYRLRLDCSLAARFMAAQLPGDCHTKSLPRWVMELPPAKQKELLIGFFRGDGWIKASRRSNMIGAGIAGEQLCNQLCGLLERCGSTPVQSYRSVLNKKIGRHFDRFSVQVQAADALWLWEAMGGPAIDTKRLDFSLRLDRYTLRQVKAITASRYRGVVHNLEVEHDHSYIVNGLVTHNCDSPIPLNCACETCLQIFWVQDETDIAAIRPPTCGGKLPGTNTYGELKVFLFPDSTIVDPSNTAAALNNKGFYPSLIFKRYQNSITPGLGEIDVVLQRNAINRTQVQVGWTMTPGPAGVAQCVWFMGLDGNGNQIRYDLNPNTTPGMLGELLCMGNLITKQMAVITDYTPTVLTNNQYQIRYWDVMNAQAVGPVLVATNIWRYLNPQGPVSGSGARQLALDVQQDILPIGTLVDLWYFQVGQISGTPINRYFFNRQPLPNPANQWMLVGGIDFADMVQTMSQQEPGGGTGGHMVRTSTVVASDDFEDNIWGLAGEDDPLMILTTSSVGGATFQPIGGGTYGQTVLNKQHRAVIDPNLPGLKVLPDIGTEPFAQRPVYLWNRISTGKNVLFRAEIGQPTVTAPFPPYDILFGASIAAYRPYYLQVMDIKNLGGLHGTVRVEGATFTVLPRTGSLRVLWPPQRRGLVWDYGEKYVFPQADHHDLILASDPSVNTPYPGQIGDIVELLHQEYSAPCLRLQFTQAGDGSILLQVKVGILGLELPYELDNPREDVDDFVRGLRGGYTVSANYSQAGSWTGVGQQPPTNVDGFVLYQGGLHTGVEVWNVLEVMVRLDQLWVWWNSLLIPPSQQLSAQLPVPVQVTTPYFPLTMGIGYGKTAMRLWPGACMRRVEVRTQPRVFSEFTYGQLIMAG
jgi:intein/homing endonuclease